MGANHKNKKGEPSFHVKDVPIPGTHPGAAGNTIQKEVKIWPM